MTLLFLKLGGSLLTDKTAVETLRPDVLARAAGEIAAACAAHPDLALVLGHGSGSFGHVAAAEHGTRQGVKTPQQWRGFAQVGAVAARLNAHVLEALRAAGVPALRLPPSASARCEDGRLVQMATQPVMAALDAGLVPLVYGDVAFDAVRGGTIVSTEEVLSYLAAALPIRPSWLLLAGETAGVLDAEQSVIPAITPDNLAEAAAALGGSHGADVTGGMASKVRGMLDLAEELPGLQIRIFSGREPGHVRQVLLDPETAVGTRLAAAS